MAALKSSSFCICVALDILLVRLCSLLHCRRRHRKNGFSALWS
jgi:hypothetical protein